ncbi:MAG TPA: tetratricopeptide repeat protein [Candidatus Limnocylindrales bacterium]|nr:tetratricopeptide repeat protein [Candidatus Limnocylindrales bacterium]
MTATKRQALTSFVDQLKNVRQAAGEPSLNQLVELTTSMKRPLPRSTISDKLNARSLPEWEFVVSFVNACKAFAETSGVPLERDIADLARWDTLHLQMLQGIDEAAADDRLASAAAAELSRRASRVAPAGAEALNARATTVVPRQLPTAVRNFVGRAAELEALTGLADEASVPGSSAVIATIDGTAGVGKTALAVHWAHQVAKRFPDGQLYANLRGFDPAGTAMTPAEALRGFLDALGVPPQRIPVTVESQAALYRSRLADRRMLVVLDNACDAEQVRPLLPGTPGCLSIVTSRSQLTSLITNEGAHPLTLSLLSKADARDLLGRRIGTGRVGAEPQAVDEIIEFSARLPLALSVVAARAASHPSFHLADLAAELRRARGGLAGFDSGDPDAGVRAVFTWSYRRLSEPAARLFRLLGVHPGPDIGITSAASLAGVPVTEVRDWLSELSRAHLVEEHTPGRFRFHDLLRAYAAERARVLDSEPDRRAAVHRMIEHYLHSASTADGLFDTHRDDPVKLSPPIDGVTVADLSDGEEALVWFTVEHPVLLAVLDQAVAAGFDLHAWRLAWTLTQYLDRRGHWQDWADTHRIALEAARRQGDKPGQAYAYRIIARAYGRLGRLDEARENMRQALRLAGEMGDHKGEANAHEGLSWLCELGGDLRAALHHAEQALGLLRIAGERTLLARELNAVGWCHAQLGDHEQALEYCHEALEINQEFGDRAGAAETWDSLGFANRHLGRFEEANGCYQHALDLWRDLGYRLYVAETLRGLGENHAASGAVEATRLAWSEALSIFEELAHPAAAELRARLNQLPLPLTISGAA